ncbi:hypothetical protein DENSPDRAFT_598079 [Dentipellis sp. KUC8613]|nr:hypothetical protein DENSPDRAFT_598079 [Dentipellis sp. KUC8613]
MPALSDVFPTLPMTSGVSGTVIDSSVLFPASITGSLLVVSAANTNGPALPSAASTTAFPPTGSPLSSQTPVPTGGSQLSTRVIIAVLVVGISSFISLVGITVYCIRHRAQKRREESTTPSSVVRPGVGDSPTPSSDILPHTSETHTSKAYSIRTQTTTMSTMSGVSYNSETRLMMSAIPSDLQTITGTPSTSRSNSRHRTHSPSRIPQHPLPDWPLRTTSQTQLLRGTGSGWSYLQMRPPAYDGHGIDESASDKSVWKIVAPAGGR